MALVIRLKQMGRTNHKTYRLVLTDKRNPRDGKYLEMLGWYDPHQDQKEKNLNIKSDRLSFWLKKGATLSEKAFSLAKRACPEVIKEFYTTKVKKTKKTTVKKQAVKKEPAKKAPAKKATEKKTAAKKTTKKKDSEK